MKDSIKGESEYFRFFENFISDKEYLKDVQQEWFKKHPGTTNHDDLIWSFAHEILNAYAEHKRFSQMSMVYFNLALFQKKRSKDFFILLQEHQRCALYDIQQQNKDFEYSLSVITCRTESCEACRALESKRFSINEALNLMPLPVKDCQNEGWCRCCYGIRIKKIKY
jgi:hypothetical protein